MENINENQIVRIFPLNKNNKGVSKKELDYLLPMLYRFTKQTLMKVRNINIKSLNAKTTLEKEIYQNEFQNIMQSWVEKVRKLGLSPVSLGKVRARLTDGSDVLIDAGNSKIIE